MAVLAKEEKPEATGTTAVADTNPISCDNHNGECLVGVVRVKPYFSGGGEASNTTAAPMMKDGGGKGVVHWETTERQGGSCGGRVLVEVREGDGRRPSCT